MPAGQAFLVGEPESGGRWAWEAAACSAVPCPARRPAPRRILPLPPRGQERIALRNNCIEIWSFVHSFVHPPNTYGHLYALRATRGAGEPVLPDLSSWQEQLGSLPGWAGREAVGGGCRWPFAAGAGAGNLEPTPPSQRRLGSQRARCIQVKGAEGWSSLVGTRCLGGGVVLRAPGGRKQRRAPGGPPENSQPYPVSWALPQGLGCRDGSWLRSLRRARPEKSKIEGCDRPTPASLFHFA